jgi:mono/diheme cytochrome c family protein
MFARHRQILPIFAVGGLAFFASVLFAAQTAKPLPANHAQNMQAGLELFKSRVRPILAENCLACHGGKEKKGDFDLSTRGKLTASGMVDEKAVSSPMYRVVAHLDDPHMPYKAARLPDASIKDIGRWIDLGAPYDRPLFESSTVEKKPKEVTAADRQYWAFLPLSKTPPPQVRQVDWPRGSIDRFLLAKMEAAGVQPVGDADRRVLIRRLYFDVIGLPPAPSEIDVFAAAPDLEKTWECLVDKLLADPHFGERWARHWLDCSRFAESHGFEHDYDRPFAYRFRDYVIRSFNADQRYDEFLRWQLAGDELAADDPQALAATGFLGAGVFPTQITVSEAERIRYDAMDDMLATTGYAMLGLTVGCARCHDHKYDPIPSRNYYQLLSAFTTTVRSEVEWDFGAKGGNPKEGKSKIQVTTEGLTPMRHHKADESIPDFYEKTYFLRRGDVAQKDGEASPGFLDVLVRHPDGARHWNSPHPPKARSSFRRAGLAAWITDSEYGAGNLAARVIVNRLWHYHFGRGIVSTLNDFGLQGDRPTHPEVLDWLAADLVANGWKLKRLHKLMLMSRAYRLCGAVTVENMALDPDNHLGWRHPRRRLEAEAIRDSLLAVGGNLDQTMFGPGTLDESMRRRSIYFTVKRSQLVPMLQVFDWPDTLTSAGVRPTTITPPQALVFLNHPQARHWVTALGARLKPAADKSLPDAVDLGYQIACGRTPSQRERSEGVAFITAVRGAKGGSLDMALTDYAWVLMSLNEFVYVE